MSRVALSHVAFGELDGAHNMALDTVLFLLCERSEAAGFLRFYSWRRTTLSLGRFESTDTVDVGRVRTEGIDLVRRPTGGRAVLHGSDITYAFVSTCGDKVAAVDLYRRVSGCLVGGLRSLGLSVDLEKGHSGVSGAGPRPCFASTSRYEVTAGGRKVVGSAQRVGKTAILQHGSIPLDRGYLRVVDYMRRPDPERSVLLREMEAATVCLEELAGNPLAAPEVAESLLDAFRADFDIGPSSIGLEAFDGDVEALMEGADFALYRPEV
jgi:lipoate-protein ligase A